jgi:uncharacterized phiE125 gp8 family phage protein
MADYTTVSAMKTYLRISTAADDDLLADLVTRASRIIDNYCGRWFVAEAGARVYDARGQHITPHLLLLDADILSVTSITNGDGTAISPDDVVLRPPNYPPYFGISLKDETGLRWTYSGSPQAAISVTGTWGYSATVPEVIAQAAIRIAALLYRQRDIGPAQPAADLLPEDIRRMLLPYVRLRVKVIS